MKKPKLYIILLFLLLQASPSPAQQFFLWQRNFGGTLDDRAHELIRTNDNDFALFGYAVSSDIDLDENNGAYDYWLIKTDAEGLLLWENNYGGAGLDEGRSLIQTTDGGYLLVGSSSSNNADVSNNYGVYDYWVVKTNSLGVLEWERNLGGTGNDRGWGCTQSSDGHFVIIGYTYSDNINVSHNNGLNDYWLVKLSNDGNILWEKNFGGTLKESLRAFQATADGGFILAGYSESDDGDVSGNYGEDDFWLVKTDSVGSLLWEKHFGGSKVDIAHVVRQTADGGYILGGSSTSDDEDLTDNNGGLDAWLFKLNASGELQWQRNFGGSLEDNIRDIQPAPDGGYLLVGESASNDGDLTENQGGKDGWIIKTDSLGTLLWQKTLGGTQEDLFEAVVALPHHAYVVGGYTRSNDGDVEANNGFYDFWMLKFQDCVFPDSIAQSWAVCTSNGNPASFNLIENYSDVVNQNGLTPHWYADANATMPVADPANVVTLGETLYLQFSLGPCLSEVFPIALQLYQHSDSTFIEETICESALPYLINGLSFDESGAYTVGNFSNSFGCDSIVLLNLNIIYHEDLGWADAGPDQIVTVAEAQLNANLPAAVSGIWSSLNGALLSAVHEPGSMATELQEGNNTFTWSLQHPLCGLYSTDTVQVFYEMERPAFFLPNTFTPNGDGDNDLFSIPGLPDIAPASYQFTVYNRWGSKVFQSDHYQNDWNGKDGDGHDLLEGTYWFVLVGGEERYQGEVLLVR